MRVLFTVHNFILCWTIFSLLLLQSCLPCPHHHSPQRVYLEYSCYLFQSSNLKLPSLPAAIRSKTHINQLSLHSMHPLAKILLIPLNQLHPLSIHSIHSIHLMYRLSICQDYKTHNATAGCSHTHETYHDRIYVINYSYPLCPIEGFNIDVNFLEIDTYIANGCNSMQINAFLAPAGPVGCGHFWPNSEKL